MRGNRTIPWLLAALALVACRTHPASSDESPRVTSAATATSAPTSAPSAVNEAAREVVALPGGEGGIGFDDLGYSATLGRVVAPAAATGRIDLIDPTTRQVTSIEGFSKGTYQGGHDASVTSADVGEGLLFAVDRTKQELVLIDTDRATIVGRRHLAAHPDYVRWIDTQRAIWVTQPDAEQIEMFSLAAGATEPTAAGTLAVPGGPESLVLDLGRGKAYTHLWRGKTVRIDLAKRALEATWANGCKGSRGIALDAERQWLFAACAEGGATVLDLEHDGSVLGRVTTARGVDVIAYDPGRRHLYLPSASDGRLTIVGVSKSGSLAVLGSMPGEKGTHCAAADDRGGVWLCDPVHGRLVVIRDPYPATSD